MLYFKNFVMAFISFLSINIYANSGELVNIPLEKVFTPHGLDTSEEIYIVVEAKLPDYCFNSNVEVIYDLNYITREITLMAQAEKPRHDLFCIQSQKTILKQVVLGNLNRGEWTIVLNKDTEDHYEASIFINDQLIENKGILKLANITSVDYEHGDTFFILNGVAESDCDSLNGEPLFVSNGLNALTVIPQISKSSYSIPLYYPSVCPKKQISFSHKVYFPRDLDFQEKTILLHIKSSGKKSYNFIVELP